MFTAQKGIMQGHGYEIVTLAGAGHEVRILPENGFNLYYWTYEGKEIFMEPADITVFDPEKIAPRATYLQSAVVAQGVRHVLVNGGIALENGQQTDYRGGKFLRKR